MQTLESSNVVPVPVAFTAALGSKVYQNSLRKAYETLHRVQLGLNITEVVEMMCMHEIAMVTLLQLGQGLITIMSGMVRIMLTQWQVNCRKRSGK